jgi:dihydroorotate dehydrogenase
MILRGIKFKDVFNAAGARNFFGQGYPYHKYIQGLGLNYTGSTFVTKTTTTYPREGNMPLLDTLGTPKEWKPKCIVVKPIKGVTLNAVGLSGPGVDSLLRENIWQNYTEPFIISYMSVGDNPAKRMFEASLFVDKMHQAEPQFKGPVGYEINVSCPNVKEHSTSIHEIQVILEQFSFLKAPLILKINAIFPILSLLDLEPEVDAINVSNTIPWGELPDHINWKGLFGSDVSPLAHLGGGGLSGKPLLPIVCRYIKELRDQGFKKAVIGGGGILSIRDATRVLQSGANGVALGAVSMLRPWRVCDIIHYVNEVVREYPGYHDSSPA